MAEPPNLTDFTTFVRNVMGIGANYLPDASPQLQHAFDQALNIVNLDLAVASAQRTSWSPYELAVYNLAGHLLVEFAADVSYALSALSWSAGVVTATTSAASQIIPGDRLVITGVSPLGYSQPLLNGVRQPQIVVDGTLDNTHFTYLISPNPGTAVLLAGAAAVEQFFSSARKQLKITAFVPGVVTSANDLSTGAGLMNPDFMRGFTLENLQLLKTAQGRAYLSIAQKYGPNVWGVA